MPEPARDVAPKAGREGQEKMCGRVIQKTPLGEIRVLFETMNAVPTAHPITTALQFSSCWLSSLMRKGIALSICCAGTDTVLGQGSRDLHALCQRDAGETV